MLLYETFPKLSPHLGISSDLLKLAYKSMHATSRKFVCYYPKSSRKFITAEVCNSVYSGEMTKTTTGNSIRVLAYLWYILWLAGVPDEMHDECVAGDDVLLFLDKKYV